MLKDKTLLENSKDVAKGGLGFMGEFKEFIRRGNALELAIGVIIGGALQTIIKSLVGDIIMPIVSVFVGGISLERWKLVLKENGAQSITLNYGAFLTDVINFLIMAFVIFVFVKAMNKLSLAKVSIIDDPKTCPYCCSPISKKATRCPQCTSQLSEEK